MAEQQNPIILTYHSISGSRPPLAISASTFAGQMEWLSRNARVVPVADIVGMLKRRDRLPTRTVALTFDDGYEDFYTEAAPELRRWGFPATVFVPTAYCGRTNSWPGQPGWVDEKPLLNWQQIEELAREGFQFGSHSVTHPDLTKLSEVDARREMIESKREILERTGIPAQVFCYPYGRWGGKVRDLASRHFSGACSTAAGTVSSDADPFALPRVDACYVRSPACFHSLFTRRFLTYIALRRIVRHLRNQPEGHYSRL